MNDAQQPVEGKMDQDAVRWFAVYRDGEPLVAYPTEIQAKVWADFAANADIRPLATPPAGEQRGDPARNVLETWCKSLGLEMGMPLHDLAFCVASRLEAKADAQMQRADWNLAERDKLMAANAALTKELEDRRRGPQGYGINHTRSILAQLPNGGEQEIENLNGIFGLLVDRRNDAEDQAAALRAELEGVKRDLANIEGMHAKQMGPVLEELEGVRKERDGLTKAICGDPASTEDAIACLKSMRLEEQGWSEHLQRQIETVKKTLGKCAACAGNGSKSVHVEGNQWDTEECATCQGTGAALAAGQGGVSQ